MIHTEVDWPGVLRLAGRFCSSERGRERLLAAAPSGGPVEVRRRPGAPPALAARAGLRPPVRIFGLDEGAPLVVRLGAAGQALPPEDLLDLFRLVERSEEARCAVPVEGLELPDLAALLAPLSHLEDLLSERDVTFEPDGRIRDTASRGCGGRCHRIPRALGQLPCLLSCIIHAAWAWRQASDQHAVMALEHMR